MNKNANYIRYTFYELRVKYNLSEEDTDRFLDLIRAKLQNENYRVYFTGARFEYRDAKIKVQDNELMIAVKEQKEDIDMNLLNECTKNEVELIKKAGIKLENKDYSTEELKRYETEITEYIMSHSSKNGDISKLSNEYSGIFRIFDK